MKSLFATITFLGGLAVVTALYVTRTGEVISVVARKDLPLLDPNTLVGKIGDRPTVIAVLPAGHSLPVIECHDRKSDIDVIAQYNGKRVVPGWSPGAYKLNRRAASMREAGAISTCLGLL